MKNALMLLALALGGLSLTAQAGNCPDVKNGIDAKLKAKGLHHYSLDVVSAGDQGSARIVGQCNRGKSVIVYSRGAGSTKVASPQPPVTAAPVAPAPTPEVKQAKPVKPIKPVKPSTPPPALGNY